MSKHFIAAHEMDAWLLVRIHRELRFYITVLNSTMVIFIFTQIVMKFSSKSLKIAQKQLKSHDFGMKSMIFSDHV